MAELDGVPGFTLRALLIQKGLITERQAERIDGLLAAQGARPSAPAAEPASGAPAGEAPSVAPAGEDSLRHPVDRLLKFMCDVKASDLHLSAGNRPMVRVDGDMRVIEGAPSRDDAQNVKLLDPILPQRNREEFARRNDTDFAYELVGQGRFRVNVFRDRRGVGAVFRLIPSRVLTVEDLGLPEAVRRFCDLPKGLVLVTGPTGSGKSTTLAAMIDHINRTEKCHIITIEDPIEFTHENRLCLVNQRELGQHTDGFKDALRAALREDPDIVLVGEMRDLETTATAIETAETGHLVFGTLHTSTASSTVDRMIDQFPAGQQAQIRTMLSNSLKGVVSQTLLKRRGGGRVAALEILVVTPGIAHNIREGKTHQVPSAIQTGGRLGMVELNASLLKLVVDGVVEPREAFDAALDKQEFLQRLEAAGVAHGIDPGAEAEEAAGRRR
ncbi:MAG: type IV pilus twitching motility protein PilT [Planctomycetes bacterium]|nr:type IV pilus twitching motility protein PilT [Planctomycetota bacterium]